MRTILVLGLVLAAQGSSIVAHAGRFMNTLASRADVQQTNAASRWTAKQSKGSHDKPVSTTVSMTINAPIQDVFHFVVAEDVLPKVLRRYGPIPPVIETRVLHGPWERVGADRSVLLGDGGTLHE